MNKIVEFTDEQFRLVDSILTLRYETLPAPQDMTRAELDEACVLEQVVGKFLDVTKGELVRLMHERGAATIGDLFTNGGAA